MKEKIRKIIKITTLVLVAAYILLCNLFCITQPEETKYVACGTVISKSQDEVVIKYGSKTNLYLNIQYDEIGFKSQLVSPTVYFSTKKGERVCFDQYNTSGWHTVLFISGVLFVFIECFSLLVLFVCYIFNIGLPK